MSLATALTQPRDPRSLYFLFFSLNKIHMADVKISVSELKKTRFFFFFLFFFPFFFFCIIFIEHLFLPPQPPPPNMATRTTKIEQTKGTTRPLWQTLPVTDFWE